jgi:hypothetical protein
MAEIEKGLYNFLRYWFTGLMQGLGNVDETARAQILQACGQACTDSYTGQVFREVRQQSPDLDSFLQNLQQRFPGARYERTGDNAIKVTYHQCGCDLVRLGLVQSPLFCQCSAANLRANFQQALHIPVSVELKTSILQGKPECLFMVVFEKVVEFDNPKIEGNKRVE